MQLQYSVPKYRLIRFLWGLAAVSLLSITATAQVSDDRDVDDAEFYEDYEELWEQGEYRRALTALEQIIDEQPRRYDKWIYRRAKLRFAVGEVDAAIEDIESLAGDVQNPQVWWCVEAALMNRYRGNLDQYDSWLRRANALFQQHRRFYQNPSENLAATGHMLELLGENPKSVLDQLFNPYIEARGRTLSAAAHVGAGDLALRASGYNVAEKYYLDALEKNDVYQPALEGLMRAYMKSGDPRGSEVMERLLEINPNNPAVHELRVRAHLDLGEIDQAMPMIEKMLEINPVNSKFQAFKAAAYYLQFDDIAMNAVIEETLAFNPKCSILFQTLGEIASRHYRFTEGLEFQEAALALDPANVEAREAYSLDLLRLGREEEGRHQLDRIFAEDPYSVPTFNMLELMDTLETFAVVERGDFTLKLPESERPVMAELALDLLDEAIELYEAKYEVELHKPVLIEMFDNHDDFMVRSVGLPGSIGHMGICFGRLITMDAPSVRPRGSSNWRSVLWHEFLHVITLQKTNNRMPRWLSEGISVYEERTYSEAFHNRLDAEHLAIVTQHGKPSFTELEYLFTKAPSPAFLMYGYFMSGEFVDFYVQEYGFDALVETLTRIGDKEFTNDALVAAAGVTATELDAAFHAYLDKRLAPLYNLMEDGGSDEESGGVLEFLQEQFQIIDQKAEPHTPENLELFSENSPHSIAIRKARIALEQEDAERALEALEEAYTLFPDYKGPDAPLKKMAEIYKLQEDRDGFRNTLERIALSSPSELGATTELVRLHREDGNMDRMMHFAKWGIGIDPYSPELHNAMLEALLAQNAYDDALERVDLLLAVDPSNWVGYRYEKASLLAKKDDIPSAKRETLELLESVPNYWNAQELLLELMENPVEFEVDSSEGESTF